MRSRDQVFASAPRCDIICWVPDTTQQFGGHFERHAALGALPAQLDVQFVTDALDLVDLFPKLTRYDMDVMLVKATGKRPSLSGTVEHPDWKRAWHVLRKSLPMTDPSQSSLGTPPMYAHQIPLPREPKLDGSVTLNGGKSYKNISGGASKPIAGPRSVQKFHILYTPNRIAAMDIKFALLQPIHAAIVRALVDEGKPILSREQLWLVLQQTKWLQGDGWGAFIRARARLIREGFIGEEFPPAVTAKTGKVGLMSVRDSTQRRAGAGRPKKGGCFNGG